MGGVGDARTRLPQSREGGVRPPAVARDQDDARAERGELQGGDLSDAGRGAGDDNDLAVNGSLPGVADSLASNIYTIRSPGAVPPIAAPPEGW